MGGDKSDPVMYNWIAPSLFSLLLPQIPWLILFIALIASLRRDKRAWAILLPLFICEMALLGMDKIFSMTPARGLTESLLYPIVNPIILSSAVILLSPDIFKRKRWIFSFLRTMLIFGGMGFMSLLILPDEMKNLILILYGVATLGFILSISIARNIARKNFRLIRFSLFLLLSTMLIMILFFMAFMAIQSAIENMGMPSGQFFQTAIVAVILSLILFVSILPFLVFSMKNRFYKERLALILGIPGIMPPATDSEVKTDPRTGIGC